MIKTNTIAIEQGAYSVGCAFNDEDDTPIIPNTIVWTLTDVYGTIINGRDQVNVPPQAETTIILSGADLQILPSETSGRKISRYLTIEATYSSDLGSPLSAKKCLVFYVENLISVT